MPFHGAVDGGSARRWLGAGRHRQGLLRAGHQAGPRPGAEPVPGCRDQGSQQR